MQENTKDLQDPQDSQNAKLQPEPIMVSRELTIEGISLKLTVNENDIEFFEAAESIMREQIEEFRKVYLTVPPAKRILIAALTVIMSQKKVNADQSQYLADMQKMLRDIIPQNKKPGKSRGAK